eukprot:IDg11211t1
MMTFGFSSFILNTVSILMSGLYASAMPPRPRCLPLLLSTAIASCSFSFVEVPCYTSTAMIVSWLERSCWQIFVLRPPDSLRSLRSEFMFSQFPLESGDQFAEPGSTLSLSLLVFSPLYLTYVLWRPLCASCALPGHWIAARSLKVHWCRARVLHVTKPRFSSASEEVLSQGRPQRPESSSCGFESHRLDLE